MGENRWQIYRGDRQILPDLRHRSRAGLQDLVSLTKLGKRYGKKKLETACERMLAFTSSPSIRTITTFLKNSREPGKTSEETESGSKYGITRGAAYWKKGGGGNVE